MRQVCWRKKKKMVMVMMFGVRQKEQTRYSLSVVWYKVLSIAWSLPTACMASSIMELLQRGRAACMPQ